MVFRVFVIACLALIGSPAAAIAPIRVCTDADLVGVWELMSIRAAEPGVEAFYAAHPVEYMRFHPDGTYIYVARNEKLPTLAAMQASLDGADARDGTHYVGRLVEPGMLIIFRDGRAFQAFTCTIPGKDRMIWSELPGNNDLERVHRRVR